MTGHADRSGVSADRQRENGTSAHSAKGCVGVDKVPRDGVSLQVATPLATIADVRAALGTIGLIAVAALSLYVRYWMFHRRDWKWDEYEYPARPSGRPSPRAGLDELD